MGTGFLAERRTNIRPTFDEHGHAVYLLMARVRRLSGSVAGAAILGRYALLCHWDELLWRVHPCNERGILEPPIAELPIQDRERSWATLYILRREQGPVSLRLMASYTNAPPHQWVQHTPQDGWPVPEEDQPELAAVGLLTYHGGIWERIGFSCGRHLQRCHAGEADRSGFGHSDWLVHSWHAPDSTTLHDVFVGMAGQEPLPEDPFPIRVVSKFGPALEDTQDPLSCSGSIYTEIHVPDEPAFEPLGEVGFTALVEGVFAPDGPKGVFFGHDLLLLDHAASLIYWSACDDAGQPIGDLVPVRNTATFGRAIDAIFSFIRVRKPDGGYNLLCYWCGSLVFKRSVAGGERVLRLGVWWRRNKPVLTLLTRLGFPLKWSCADTIVPCPDCHEELRRDPPIAVRVTLNTIGPRPGADCTCEITQPVASLVHSPLGIQHVHSGYFSLCRYDPIYAWEPDRAGVELLYAAEVRMHCPPWLPSTYQTTGYVGCAGCAVNVVLAGVPPWSLLKGRHSPDLWDGQTEVIIGHDGTCEDPSQHPSCLVTSVTITPLHTPFVAEA
jgi:hypothetical protein